VRFHHMCIVTTDLEGSIKLWRDVLGFTVNVEMELPDGPEPGPTVFANAKLMNDAFEIQGARSKMALLSSPEGALIELQQPEVPAVELTPARNLRYRHSGIHELGLAVDNIDAMFDRVKAAGYKTATDYVWSSGTLGRSFIFFDNEGNMIQLWQAAEQAAQSWA
jgi:catechol 2,3-dioxygenase-like lactoylglutathione lyase family enzyme